MSNVSGKPNQEARKAGKGLPEIEGKAARVTATGAWEAKEFQFKKSDV
jgi:hypothetical protein